MRALSATMKMHLLALPLAALAFSSAPEPWAPLHGGGFTGPAAPFSPDPLVRYVWPDIPSVNDTALQIFPVAPVSCGPAPGTPAASFSNASGCAGTLLPAITVSGQGTLLVDFGVELPGWLEFDSEADLDVQSLTLGISEYTKVDWVGGFKQGSPKKYGGGPFTYRLETNPELYEGVRFGFIQLAAAPSAPFTITGLRAVSQAKPVNYVGAFSSAGDPLLERVWWTAAYTVRAALQSTYMGSILMDRGDRFSWTGDAHPSQATAMAAFGNYGFVFNNLNRSKADCQGIATYCLYFVLSVADYFEASGDAAGVAYLTPNVVDHLESAAGMWANPQGLRFVGWDVRVFVARAAPAETPRRAHSLTAAPPPLQPTRIERAPALQTIPRPRRGRCTGCSPSAHGAPRRASSPPRAPPRPLRATRRSRTTAPRTSAPWAARPGTAPLACTRARTR